MGKESETIISYKDSQIIFSKNIGEADETTIFDFDNGQLFRKNYTIMQDENAANMNSFSEEKLIENCVQNTINSELWTKICSSKTGEFPFIYDYTSYQDGAALQRMNYKITKKTPLIYEQYFTSDEESQKLLGTYYFNEKNQLTSFNFTKNDDVKKLEVEYSYFP